MKKAKFRIVLLGALIVYMLLLSGCGNVKEESEVEENSNSIIDMSVYKGEGGYVIENNIFDYSEVFDVTYDWGQDIKMPFPKMEGTEAVFSDYDLMVPNVNEDSVQEYVNGLKNLGYSTSNFRGEGYIKYIIYNDKLQASFIYRDGNMKLYLFYGFANKSNVSIEEIRKLIDSKELLKENTNFDKYYILPIENKSVREEGLYEYMILTEEYADTKEDNKRPYYLITDGEDIYLFEQGLTGIYFPNTANILKSNEMTQLIVTAAEYIQTNTSGESKGYTGIFTYELQEKSFVRVDQQFIKPESVTETYIGKIEDGNFKIYRLKEKEDFDIKKGRKTLYKIVEEYR